MLFLLSLFPALFAGSLTPDEDFDDQIGAEDENGKTLIGTIGPDAITGTDGNDDIIGLLGDDTLDGTAGDDVLQGLNGDDLLIGGVGNDAMQGRGDDDTLQGFDGDDWVDGNDGSDVVRGGVGSDVVIGGMGEDIVNGRSGDDVVVGGEFNADPLSTAELGVLRDGGTINDIFVDGTPPVAELRDDGAADQLLGGEGSDLLIAGAGDEVTGGRELDAFAIIADNGDSDLGPATITDFNKPNGEAIALYFRADETVDEDAISVADEDGDALVSYDGEVLARVTGAAGTLTADDIEILQPEDPSTTPVIDGTESDDNIVGTAADEIINGLGEEDVIEGRAGNDTISGGDGSDIVQGQAGFDVITGNADNDYLQGRGGDDTLSGNQGFDWVDGNDGDDRVNGGLQADTVIGGTGADLLSGGEGNDVVIGGELLADPLTTSQLTQVRNGEELDDLVPGVGDTFTPFDDSGSSDTLDGGNGDDLLIFGQNDIAAGGAGEDTFAILGQTDATGVAQITDYSATDDSIVVVDTQASANPQIVVDASGADALVFLNGAQIATVTGAAATLTAANVTVVTELDTSLVDPNS